MLTAITIGPILAYKLVWLSSSKTTIGTMYFMGKSIDGQFSHTYPVIKFTSNGSDTVFFNGTDEWKFAQGEEIPVRFQGSHPHDARINLFKGIWMDTIIYAAIPFIMLLIIYLHPGIVPRGSKIVVGKKPFIRLI